MGIFSPILDFGAGKGTETLQCFNTTHKRRCFVLMKHFQLYFKFLAIDFCNFFKYLRSFACQWYERKKLGGLCVCLGYIAQNITKMGVFCWFSKRSLGRVLQKLAQISIFPINFTNCQFNCIIFVKEEWNFSKIIILGSCAEELRTTSVEWP